MDAEFAEAEVEEEIAENANKEMIDITDASYTVGEAEEEGSTEGKAEDAADNPPKQEQKGKNQQKDKEPPKNLMDMAEEEGPGY
jgi:hypothetical protein